MTRKLITWRQDRGTELPSRGVEEFFDDFFSTFAQGHGQLPWVALTPFPGRGQPSTDVAETEDEVTVTADLPGLEEKDIEVTLENDVLSIRGTRQEAREEKKKEYHLVERAYGEFHRSFYVPEGIDQEKMKASFKNGVLKISLPKRPEAKPSKKKIEITGT